MRGPVVAVLRASRRFRFWLPGLAPDAFRRAKAVTWKRVKARVLAARARAVLAVDVRDLLADSPHSIQYLASTRDEVVGRDCLREILRIAPQTEVAEIDGPHMALFTNPVPATAHIVEFLRGRAAG
jgi:pimeloyl-ACP methyl ester carboxylesterase